jgi:lipopolysaccharide export system protein LptA
MFFILQRMTKFFSTCTVGLAGLLAALTVAAQKDSLAPPLPFVDSTRILHIENALRLNIQKIDSVTTLQSLAVNVRVRQASTLFYADSAVINQFTLVMQAFGGVHINDSDSMHTYARYLRYTGKDRLAYLRDNVKLLDNKGSTLTTSELEYNLNTQVAIFKKGGKVVNKKTVLTSKEGIYYGTSRDVIFKKDVVLRDPDFDIFTDSLLYNANTEIATFIAPTTILNKGRKIYTSSGYYDLKQGKAFFSNRPRVIDSTASAIADNMAFDDSAGFAQLEGNVVYVDTANGVSILSNQLFVNNKKKSFLATQKPLMILVRDGDSTYISADTLFSDRITNITASRTIPVLTDTTDGYTPPDLTGKDSSMNRFFEAWNHVRIFSDSVQAVCDSLFYAATDSVFRLYRDPILWGSESQLTADTIYLFTKNSKTDRLQAFFNGFIVQKVDVARFNQVKGNTINALFKEGNINYVRAKGRAETVYFVADDEDKFIGMNRATSDAIDMFFEDKKPKKVKFINDLKGVTYPMRQIPPGEDNLKGFKWLEDRRPKTKFELF